MARKTDKTLLLRRQKDLDKRTADLQKYFERLANAKMANMQDTWDELEYRLRMQVKQMYKGMGALQDPKKIKTLKNKAARLEAFVEQLQNDIVYCGNKQQPYLTSVLQHQLEKSYYMNAWALEQAAQVNVLVPVLTPAQVLGVLVNPWLPDKANYSDRIRANTALLAQDMKEIIQEAVEEGLDWNTVAQNISTKTGEGYFRAVRLARTELARAQALGASYSYIQNNDILDGKRWNAVLDSRTAPKDAANDGKLYDLDYDTPEKPSIAGQHIPNHPHCRCIWSPVLSALGVNKGSKVARGQGDSPDRFGERTYTPARTYREYAKEHGLPDLDDRLANDNAKSYLRRGESVVDLHKKVKKWTYRGKSIVVPEPSWVNPNNVTPIAKSKQTRKAKAVSVVQPVKRPAIIQSLVDATNKHCINGSIVDRRKFARELLDTAGLNHVPVSIEKQNSRGYCRYGAKTSSGTIYIEKYSLQAGDTRSDLYQVKTAFHELYHATSDNLGHDFYSGINGWSFNNWVDIEETFAESASHYMIREAGITDKLQPAYPDKLVRNLPQLKKLTMFKGCNKIEDFGEVVAQYRIVDKKPSLWHNIRVDMDKLNQNFNMDSYVRQNYADYIINNLEHLVDKTLENSPESIRARALIINDAKTTWQNIQSGGTIPVYGNSVWVFNNLLAAAFKELGVL